MPDNTDDTNRAGANPWELTEDEREEYNRLVDTGRYTDDAVVRLRAMRKTRGDEYVHNLALALKDFRDNRPDDGLDPEATAESGSYGDRFLV